jgi:hypothetical protein
LLRLTALAALFALAAAGNLRQAWAESPAEVTRVGGDFNEYGERLTVLRNAGATVFKAAPRAAGDLAAAWQRVAQSPSTRGFGPQLGFIAVSFALFAVAVFATRRATARTRRACSADALRARGAAGVLAFDALDRIVVAALAYILFEQWCDFGTTQDYTAVALVWAAVRWWMTMWLVEALLRPGQPELRLVPMQDRTARAVTGAIGVALALGIAAISVMPVLLRVELPLASAQFIAIVQGVVVAAGGAIGLWLYRRGEMARPGGGTPRPARRRFWFAAAVAALAIVWLAWTVGALLLKFSIYHSLVWSLRIAAFAFIVDSVLGLSARVASDPAAPPVAMWIPLAQRSIRVAAILAIAILFAEVWLVDELAIVERQAWEPVRRSLITAALTLLAGYVAWRYLNQWTEARLRAAVPGMGEAESRW